MTYKVINITRNNSVQIPYGKWVYGILIEHYR